MRYLLVFLLCNVLTCQACWFQSREKSVNLISKFARESGFDVARGVSRHDLDKGIALLPTGISYVVSKAGGVQEIMKRCDLNGDGYVHLAEIQVESECLNACWKQIAINTFL